MKSFILALLTLLALTYSRKHCNEKQNFFQYFKVKNCRRSNLSVVLRVNVDDLKGCMKTATDKHGLAFNFSPEEAREHQKDDLRNCEILGCSETGNSSTLVSDLAFDYYSAYGNWNTTENASCIKSVGMFKVTPEKQTYLDSVELCQSSGADLADVTTEIRTKYLSQLLNNSVSTWYKVAYVGLDDYSINNTFLTSFGTTLDCSTYRAWAPGHPRKNIKDQNCVVLDSEKMWRVVKCNRKMHAVCEFYPEKPVVMADMMKKNCSSITNKFARKSCEAKKYIWQQYQNSSRLEKCEILNDLYEEIEN